MNHIILTAEQARVALQAVEPVEVRDEQGRTVAHLTPLDEDAISRAKAIIAGRLRPQPLALAPAVQAFLERELNRLEPPPTPQAVQTVADSLNLQAHYGGRPVACFTTQEGVLTVLASGADEIDALLKSLSEEEQAKVVIEYPDCS